MGKSELLVVLWVCWRLIVNYAIKTLDTLKKMPLQFKIFNKHVCCQLNIAHLYTLFSTPRWYFGIFTREFIGNTNHQSIPSNDYTYCME